jgi:hypothetical protein
MFDASCELKCIFILYKKSGLQKPLFYFFGDKHLLFVQNACDSLSRLHSASGLRSSAFSLLIFSLSEFFHAKGQSWQRNTKGLSCAKKIASQLKVAFICFTLPNFWKRQKFF